LHMGCIDKDVDFVKFLLNKGADVNAITSKGHTPLYHAVFGVGEYELVKLLLENGAKVNMDERVMYWAAGEEDSRILQILIKYGGNVNHTMNYSSPETPLIRACEEGKLANVKLLVSAGANINFENFKTTPLRTTLNKILYGVNKKVLQDYIDIANVLIDNGANVNQESQSEGTILMLASRRDYLNNTVLNLIKHGAKINTEKTTVKTFSSINSLYKGASAYESSALIEAVRGAAEKNIKTLINNGAKINNNIINLLAEWFDQSRTDRNRNKIENIIKLLIDNGASLNKYDKYGDTPLTISITGNRYILRKGNPSMAQILIAHGANVNKPNKNNFYPIQLAVIKNRPSILQLLIKSGANIHIKDNQRNDLFNLAKKYHAGETVLKILKNNFN